MPLPRPKVDLKPPIMFDLNYGVQRYPKWFATKTLFFGTRFQTRRGTNNKDDTPLPAFGLDNVTRWDRRGEMFSMGMLNVDE